MGLQWDPDGVPLSALLDRIVAAETLAKRLGTVTNPTSRIKRKPPVAVAAVVRPSPLAMLEKPGSGVTPGAECKVARAQMDISQETALQDGHRFKQCDRLEFAASAKRKGPYDVNRIHIDASYCVRVGYTRLDGKTISGQPGPNMTMCSDCPGGYSAGDERLILLVSKAERNSPALNLTGLVETCKTTRQVRIQDRSAVAFLEALADNRLTRGGLGRVGVTDLWVESYRWTILPKPVAFAENGRALP